MAETNIPKISVLMPMRDAADYVSEAIGSVLGQAGADVELIVIDDGSTDGSGDVVRGLNDPRIRLLPGPERGISAALNMALDAARGAIVMRCDADDRYPPDRLAHQEDLLEAHPDAGAVTGAYRSIDPAGRPVAELCQDLSAGDITDVERSGKSGTHLCTFAIRASFMRDLGGFREAFVTAEDIDFKLRLAEVTRIWFDPKPVYEYRLHDSSITHVQSTARRTFYETLARSCQKERAEGMRDCVERGEIPQVPADSTGARRSAEHLRSHLGAEAWRRHSMGDWSGAIGLGWRALRIAPNNPKSWRNMLLLTLKRPK